MQPHALIHEQVEEGERPAEDDHPGVDAQAEQLPAGHLIEAVDEGLDQDDVVGEEADQLGRRVRPVGLQEAVSSSAPAWIAASAPVSPIQMAGRAIAARIEAMKMKESGVSGQGQSFVAQFADWKKPRASTSAAIPARQRP